MSYILEALRKSEQERDPKKVPDLATHHRHVTTEKKSRLPYWIIGVSLLAVNVIYIIYNMNQETQIEQPAATSVTEVVENIPTSTVAVEVTPSPVEEKPIVNEAVQERSIEKTFETKTEPTFAEQNPSSLGQFTPKDISELSSGLQKQIPSMDFTTHIFIREGGSFIIINGKTLSNGMPIEQGLRVYEITSEGVILDFQGQRFFLSSMTNWQQY